MGQLKQLQETNAQILEQLAALKETLPRAMRRRRTESQQTVTMQRSRRARGRANRSTALGTDAVPRVPTSSSDNAHASVPLYVMCYSTFLGQPVDCVTCVSVSACASRGLCLL